MKNRKKIKEKKEADENDSKKVFVITIFIVLFILGRFISICNP